jgi:hypothetical protein
MRKPVGLLRRVMPSWRRLLALGAPFLAAVAGCGGIVVDPDAWDESSQDGGADAASKPGGGSGSGSTATCRPCDGEPACAFCLIQSYEATYVCPVGKQPPRPACMNLGEEYPTAQGQITCHYCR